MDPAGVGVLIGIGTMVGSLFACYVRERCVTHQHPHLHPLLVPTKPKFELRNLFPKSSTLRHIPSTSQTSSSVHLPIESA
jgi:hypothetical protein